ncbi:RelA/SpoT domain-containing protein [Rhodocyclaceae bacterium]
MPFPTTEVLDQILIAYDEIDHDLTIFMDGIRKWFDDHKRLRQPHSSVVHSVKSRLKDRNHLKDKVCRKWDHSDPITPENIFEKITDLAGVRVLHLYQDQFPKIHAEILDKVERQKDWVLVEPPKAYTWDPETRQFFEDLKVGVEIKESYYTSVHYVVRPRLDSPLCCEIQVRTLFEEIWGEVDHALNYPNPSMNLACREQLKVLAKLVGAGSRLVDSIFRSAETGGELHEIRGSASGDEGSDGRNER